MTNFKDKLAGIQATLSIPDSFGGLRPVLGVLKTLIVDHELLADILQVTAPEIENLLVELVSEQRLDKLDSLKFEQGWCESFPIYALLLESAQSLPQLPVSIWSVVGVVLEFCLINKQRFEGNPQRLELLCRSLRRLMVMAEPLRLIGNHSYKNAAEVSLAMSRLSEHTSVANADRKYAACIATTLKSEWQRKFRIAGTTRTGSRSGRRARPVAGSHQKTDHPAISFVEIPVFAVQDDVLSVPEQISGSIVLEVQPDATRCQNRSSWAVIQDKSVSRVHSIDTTRYLVQTNNKNLMSTSLFQPDEIEALLAALFSRTAKNSLESNCKLLISLVLWTGLPVETLFEWQYNNTGPGLILHDQIWYTQIFIAPILTSAKPQTVLLTCPPAIVVFANSMSAERLDSQLFTIKNLTELVRETKQWLERVSRRSGCSLSLERVQNYIADRLQCCTSLEPSCLRLAFGTERNHYRVTRFYTQLTIEYVCNALSGLWQQIGAELDDPNLLPPGFTNIEPLVPLLRMGSQRTGEPEQFQRLTESLRSACNLYGRQQIEFSVDNLVNYHNHYMEYSCLMLFSGIGCRVVRNPIPSLSLIFEHDLLVVCDKDDVDVATRVVTLCETVRQQLDFYLEHLTGMALRVAAVSDAPALNNQRWFGHADNDLAELKNILKMKKLSGQFFYLRYVRNELVCVAITPKEVSQIMQKFGLVTNAARHYLRSELVDYGVNQELINQLIGHWSVGESPFGQWSQLSLHESRKILKPILNRIVGEQGWTPLRSKLV